MEYFAGSAEPHTIADDTATRISLDRMLALRGEMGRARGTATRGITQLPGLARTRLRGRGLDFDEMRPYVEGDDLRHIDWNVTARTGRPHTRLYREERERAVTVAVDLRRAMFTGSQRLKAVAASEMAAALLWRVSANQDRAAAIAFGDDDMEFSRPSTRERGVLEAIAAIDRVFGGARGDLGSEPAARCTLQAIVAHINALGRGAGLTVLVSGCDDPGDQLDDELAIAGKRERLVVIRLVDPLETSPPPAGVYRYDTGSGPREIAIDRQAAQSLRRRLTEMNAAIAARFASANVPYFEVPSGVMPQDAVALLAEQRIM